MAAVLLTLFSCVKEGYDFKNGVDGTVDIQGNISLPLGNTEMMPIGDFLELDTSSSVLGTDNNGNYIMTVDGDPVRETVEIPRISLGNPLENGGFEVRLDVRGLIGDFQGTVPDETFTVNADPESTEIIVREDITDITDIVRDISKVYFDAPVDLVISLKDGTQYLENGQISVDQGFSISFPDFVTIEKISGDYDVVNGSTLVFNGLSINAGSSETFSFRMSSIDFGAISAPGQGMVGNELIINDNILLEGLKIRINPSTFSQTVADIPENLMLDISMDTPVEDIGVKAVSAVIDPDVRIDAREINIGELPEFLSGPDVLLDLYNPVIRFDINAMADDTPDENFPEFALSAALDAFKDGSSTMESPVIIDISGENAIRKGCNHIYVSRRPVEIPDDGIGLYMEYWHNVVEEDLGNIVRTIPDYVRIDDMNVTVPHAGNETDGYVESDYVTVIFPDGDSPLVYSFDMDYSLDVPLAFGSEVRISYSTDFNGWNSTFNSDSPDKTSDFTVDLREATVIFDFVNSIPLNLDVTADAIDLDGNIMDDISVELNGTVQAGNIGNETSTALEIDIQATQESLKRFDGLRLNISALAAGDESLQGEPLNKNQGIRLDNIKVNIDGGVQLNLKEKEK